MAEYDYIRKSYGYSSVWNLAPGEDSDPPLEILSASPELFRIAADSEGRTFTLEFRGSFEFQTPLTSRTLYNTQGQISSVTIYLGQELWQEEHFPSGTQVAAWIRGGYGFEMSVLDGNDYFAGSPITHDNSADGVRGGAGNDTFIGYGSVASWGDKFFGEAGIDTSIYRGNLSEYTIEWSDSIYDDRDGGTVSGLVVTDTVTWRDDNDSLVGVERLQFADVTMAFDTDGIAGQAYRIYKAAFDRQPDADGLGFWVNRMDAGMTLDKVAGQFIGSAEFIRMYGANPSNEAFIDLLYANVLDRQADQSGYDFWIDAMDRGLTRAGLLAEFSESAENIANVAALIENGIQYVPYDA